MGLGRKLASNSFYLLVDLMIANSLGLAFWFIVGRMLSPANVGITSTAINLALMLSSVSLLGFQSALPKLIPEYLSMRKSGQVVGLIRFAAKTILPLNIAIILALALASPALSNVIKLPADALAVSVLIMLFVSASGLFGSVMYGYQDMKRFLQTDMLGVIAKATSAAAMLFIGFNYLGPLFGVLAGFVLIGAMRFRREWFFSKAKAIDGRKILSEYSLPSFVTTLTAIASSNLQIMILAAMTTQSITGVYSLVFLITSFIAFVPNILSQALFPIISALSARYNAAKQSYMISAVFRYTIFLVLPAAVFFAMFARPIMFLIRPEYLVGASFFPILTAASVLFGLGNMFLSNLYAIGKCKLQRNIWVFISVAFLIMAAALTAYYSALGMSLAYLSFAILSLLSGYYFLNRNLPFKINWGGIAKCAVASAVFAAALIAVDIVPYSLPVKIALSAASFAVYLSLLVPMKFYNMEDIRVLEILAQKLPATKSHMQRIIGLISGFVEK